MMISFNIAKYKNQRTKALIFKNTEINPGSYDKIEEFNNKYSFIYIDTKKDENYPDCYFLAFKDIIDDEILIEIGELIVKNHENDPYKYLTDIINSISGIFDKKRKENLKKRYLALMYDLFFIYKSQSVQRDISNNYLLNEDNKHFEFVFKEDTEVKLCISSNKSNSFNEKFISKLSLKDINKLNDPNQHNELCVIVPDNKRSFNDETGEVLQTFNLLDIFNRVNLPINLTDKFKEEISNLYDCAEDLFNNYKINIEGSSIFFYDKDYLPKILFNKELNENDSVLLDAQFLINSEPKTEKLSFVEMLDNLIKK